MTAAMTPNIEWPTIAAHTRFSLTHEAATGIVSDAKEPGAKTVSRVFLRDGLITSLATWRLVTYPALATTLSRSAAVALGETRAAKGLPRIGPELRQGTIQRLVAEADVVVPSGQLQHHLASGEPREQRARGLQGDQPVLWRVDLQNRDLNAWRFRQ